MRVVARAVAGVLALGAAASGIFFAVVFFVFSYQGRKPRLTNPPLGPTCVGGGDSVCGAWEAPSGVLEWSPWIVLQAVILAVIVVSAMVGWWYQRGYPNVTWKRLVSRLRILVAAWLVLFGVVILLDLWIYVVYWFEWTDLGVWQRAGPDTSFGSAAAIGTAVAIPLAVSALWGAVVLVRRERRLRVHGMDSDEGGSLSRARALLLLLVVTVWALVMCGGLLYLVTWPFQTRESLRARCGLWPPLADAECTWETPGRFSAWVLALVWVAVVIVALALFTAMAWWVDAVRLERRPRLPHWVPTTLAAVACASIAIEAVVIRQAYEHEWVTWAEGVTRIYGTPYVYPADQIAEGTRVFIPIAVVFAVAAIAFVALAVRAGRGSRRHEAAAPVVVQA